MAQGGLALAYSLAGIFNMLILLLMLRKRIGAINGRQMILSFGQTLLASTIMGLACFYSVQFFEATWGVASKMIQFFQLSLGIGMGVVVFAFFAFVFRMEESELVLNILRRKFRKKRT
jgi:putative peptidoglycan lipid II flippase